MSTEKAAHQFLLEWADEVRYYQIQAFEHFIKTLISQYGIFSITHGILLRAVFC